jgi:hypothetical protein
MSAHNDTKTHTASLLQYYHEACARIYASSSSVSPAHATTHIDEDIEALYAALAPEERIAAQRLTLERLIEDALGDPDWCLADEPEVPRWPGGSPRPAEALVRRQAGEDAARESA